MSSIRVSVLTVVVGLPGSGKSTFVEKMKLEGAGFCVHDFHADAYMNSPQVEHSRHYPDLVRNLHCGVDCVIADIAFCDPARRVSLEQTLQGEIPNLRITWTYFENAPEKCARNIKRRARSSLAADMDALWKHSAVYRIPHGVSIIPVYEA